MRLSYSELSTYRRCPRAYRYRAVEKIQRKKKTSPLYLGSAVHRLMLAHYMGQDISLVWGEMMDEAESKTICFADELVQEQDLSREAVGHRATYLNFWAVRG